MCINVITYTYTCEAFPTNVRGTAVSICALHARVASIFAPSLSLSLYTISPRLTIGVYFVVSTINVFNMLFIRADKRGATLETEES